MTLNQALQKLKQSSVDKTLLQVAGDIKSLIQEKNTKHELSCKHNLGV